MMRVLFNATALRVPLAGVGQYTLRLAQALAAHGGIDLDFFDGHGMSRELRCDPSAQRGRLYTLARDALPGAYAARRWLMQRRFDRGSAGHDLYHEPATLALGFDGPTVLTVHDLSWIRHPQAHPAARVRELERNFVRGLRQATRVITGSSFVKEEIVSACGTPAGRIDVIPHGCDAVFHPRDALATQAARERWCLRHAGYFLCVGTLEPRKNLQLALRAHAQLPEDIRSRFPLAVAGLKGWGASDLGRIAAAGIARGEVRVLGYLPREELVSITAGALALVYPSRYEGFGLPPLEAMACGVPPITSDAASLPELVGDAGIMVDPDDEAALGRAMHSLASDPQLREALAKRALERAAPFTWQASADATMGSYRAALGGESP